MHTGHVGEKTATNLTEPLALLNSCLSLARFRRCIRTSSASPARSALQGIQSATEFVKIRVARSFDRLASGLIQQLLRLRGKDWGVEFRRVV